MKTAENRSPRIKSLKRSYLELVGGGLLLSSTIVVGLSFFVDRPNSTRSTLCDPQLGYNALALNPGKSMIEVLYNAGIRDIELRVPRDQDMEEGQNYANDIRQKTQDREFAIRVKSPPHLALRSGTMFSANGRCVSLVNYRTEMRVNP